MNWMKAGMALGVVMVIAAISSAAPGFNYPQCQSDNGSNCSAGACWIDESTRVKAAAPATGGYVEVVFFSESRTLYICVPNAQRTQYQCTMTQTGCAGDRYASNYLSPGTECSNNSVPPNPPSLTFLGSDLVNFNTCDSTR